MANRRTLDNLIALMVPEIRDIFLDVMQDIVDQSFIDEMIKAIEAGDAEALFRATGFTPVALQPILDAIERVYQDSGEITGNGFPKRLRTPIGSTVFRFDMRNQAVENDLKTFSSQFVTRLTDEARTNVKSVLEQGMITGDNPRRTALDIVGRIDPVTKQRTGGIIGLTTQQEAWVANGRKYLESLDPKYLKMELRDKRFDDTVKKAIETGQPLPSETVSKLMTAYKNKALKYRADTIAKTETIQSINRAEYRAHVQAVEEGTLSEEVITRHWDAVGDEKTRSSHMALEKKYKTKGVGLNEPFVTNNGARMMFPGDSSLGAPASEIVACRCRQKIKVDWLAGVE